MSDSDMHRLYDALARLQQVRELHAPTLIDLVNRHVPRRCAHCGHNWPCPTIRAIDEGA